MFVRVPAQCPQETQGCADAAPTLPAGELPATLPVLLHVLCATGGHPTSGPTIWAARPQLLSVCRLSAELSLGCCILRGRKVNRHYMPMSGPYMPGAAPVSGCGHGVHKLELVCGQKLLQRACQQLQLWTKGLKLQSGCKSW